MTVFSASRGLIVSIHGRMILDSRGNPAVEVEVVTDDGAFGRAAVPSGASTGEHEAVELRDKGATWHGKGVAKALANINEVIRPQLLSKSVFEQRAIDQLLLDLGLVVRHACGRASVRRGPGEARE